MSRPRFTVQRPAAGTGSPAPVAPGPRSRPREASSTAGTVIGILGWLMCVGVVTSAVVVSRDQARRLAQTQNAATQRITELNNLKAKTIDEGTKQQKELVAQINAALQAQSKLQTDSHVINRTLEKIVPTKDALLEDQQRLQKRIATEAQDKELIGDTLTEAQARLGELVKTRGKLLDLYRARYEELEQELEAARAKGTPEALRNYYNTRGFTPFGPAAAFLAGDAYAEQRKFPDALHMYGVILQRFADSAYADTARSRIELLKQRGKSGGGEKDKDKDKDKDAKADKKEKDDTASEFSFGDIGVRPYRVLELPGEDRGAPVD